MKTKLLRLTSAVIIAMFVTTVSSSWVVCPPDHEDGTVILFPNPADCSTFFQCSGGIAFTQVCPPGLYYCEELQVCSWINDRRCSFNCTITDGRRPPGDRIAPGRFRTIGCGSTAIHNWREHCCDVAFWSNCPVGFVNTCNRTVIGCD